MKTICPYAVCTLCLVVSPAAAQQPDPWQTIPVLQSDEVSVRLKVLRKATAADFEWLALEFETKTRAALPVRNAYYHTGAERVDPKTGQVVATGSLASGNMFDLFPEGWNRRPAQPELAPAAVQRVAQQPSDYSTAILGMPPTTGWLIRARLHLTLEVKGQPQLQTPTAGVPFTFEWHPPDQAGYRALRARLKKLLANPEQRPQHDYILGAYLKMPEVAREVTRDELLAAIDRRGEGFGGRTALVGGLGERFGKDPVVVVAYRTKLQQGDRAALNDLAGGTVWDPSLVEPLVALFERNPVQYRYALDVLHSHHADWARDQKLARRLSAVVFKEFPSLAKPGDAKTPVNEGWALGVADLAKTGDRAVIDLLRPRLDDRRELYAKPRPDAFGRVLPHRACDVALQAILAILDGDSEAVYRRASREANVPLGRGNEAAWDALRDRMIVELKERLAKGSQP
jgi:hypothetical protein